MGKSALGREDHVDIGIATTRVLAAAHADERAVLIAFIDQVMSVGASLRPGRAVACSHHLPAIILYKHRFSREHHQKLVLAVVPVTLRRPCAGLEHDMAHAEISETSCGGQAAVP